MSEEYQLAQFDLENIKRMTAKFPSHIPTNIQKIPTEEERKDWIKFLAYNGLWLILTYGADLINMVSPVGAKLFKALVKWKFEWNQKEVPFDIESLKK